MRIYSFFVLQAYTVRELVTFLLIFEIQRVRWLAVSLLLIAMSMSQRAYELPAYRCWKCPAPIKVTSHGMIKYMKCKNDECGLIAHPACAARGGCCQVPDYEEVNERAKKILPRVIHEHGVNSAAGKAELDASFIISSSATGLLPQLTPSYASVSTSYMGVSYSTTSTTVTTTCANTTTPSIVTTVSSLCSTHPIVMPSRLGNTPTNVSMSAPNCSEEVEAIFEGAGNIDNSMIADAIKAMARSATDTNMRIQNVEKDQRAFQGQTVEYFKRTATLEIQVKNLNDASSAQNRVARDARCIARAAELGYASDQIKVTGLPMAEIETVQRVIQGIVRICGVDVNLDVVTAVRPCVGPAVSDPCGPDEFFARESAQAQRRSIDAFVTLKYAELRDIIINKFKSSGPFKLSDVCPAVRSVTGVDAELRIFEVLSPAKYALFMDTRRRASEIGISKVWHSNGTIFARRSNDSKSIRVVRVGDLERIRQD